ncbi:MAG: hypothetical protein AUK31_07115 [Fibrobacteres bacterium CG2_30_45_31]|nr:MAG: hypothetical protein AUK31_07115 [Fibrobacteres bacterium CG2_30_45_31]
MKCLRLHFFSEKEFPRSLFTKNIVLNLVRQVSISFRSVIEEFVYKNSFFVGLPPFNGTCTKYPYRGSQIAIAGTNEVMVDGDYLWYTDTSGTIANKFLHMDTLFYAS